MKPITMPTIILLACLMVAPAADAAPVSSRMPALELFFACRAQASDPAARAGCEAHAQHELGLTVEPWEPRRAAKLFEAAIAADPSFAPPYFGLARLALDEGIGTTELFTKLKGLLGRAPKTPELVRLRKRMEGW